MKFTERNKGFGINDIRFQLTGKKAIIEEETINNTKIHIIITYYNETNYKKDFKDWTDIQQRIFKPETSQKIEGFKKYDYTLKPIQYSNFRNLSTKFLTRILFQVLSDNKDLLNERLELTIQLKVTRTERWTYNEETINYDHNDAFPTTIVDDPKYKALLYDILDTGHVYFEFSGIYLLQSIVAPFIMEHRIDYNFIYKYLSHEMEHYIKFARQSARYETLKKKLQPYMSQKGNYLIDYLYLTLFWMMVEGMAEFRKTHNIQKISINPNIIHNFRNIISTMMEYKRKSELEEYFQNKIYAGSNDGVYTCGMYICYIIAFTIDKNAVIVTDKNIPISEIASFIASNNKFYVSSISKDKQESTIYTTSISKDAFEKTIDIVGQNADPMNILRLYDDACKKLNIPEESMIISLNMFKKFFQAAESIYEEEIINKLRALEYYPRI